MARARVAFALLALFVGVAAAGYTTDNCCTCGGNNGGILNGNNVNVPIAITFSQICGNSVNVAAVPIGVLNKMATACGKGTATNSGRRLLTGCTSSSCGGSVCYYSPSLLDVLVGPGGILNNNNVAVPVNVTFDQICGNSVAILALPVDVANSVATACGNGSAKNGKTYDSSGFLAGVLGGLLGSLG